MALKFPTRALMVCVLSVLLGCGSAGNPTSPHPGEDAPLTGTNSNPQGEKAAADSSDHTLFGFWNIDFNIETRTIETTEDRSALAHFDITDFLTPPECSDCLNIEILSVDMVEKLLEFNVTLKNPFPSLDGYCIRGILISDDPNHLVINADGYSTFWDSHDPVQINPFLGFPQPTLGNPNPMFEGGAEHTRKYILKFGDPPGFLQIKYAIDASYPTPPDEPCLITDISTDGTLFESGGSTSVSLKAIDAMDDINAIKIDTSIFTGIETVMTPLPDALTWETEIENDLGVAAGDYRLLITATSDDSGDDAMYHYVDITVEPDVIDPPTACFDIVSNPPFIAGETISFNASCSTGEIIDYIWSWEGDPETTQDPAIDHIFPDPGDFEISLTVSGPGGVSDPVIENIHIDSPLTACFEIESNAPYYAGVPLSFNADCSTGEILEYQWSWDGDPETTPDPTIDHVFDNPGDFEISLIVSGPGGSTDPVTQEIHIEAYPTLNFNEITQDGFNWNGKYMDMYGTYAIVGVGVTITVFDLTDMANPILIKQLDLPGSVEKVQVFGDYAWVRLYNWEDTEVYSYSVLDLNPIESIHQVNLWIPQYKSISLGIDGDIACLGIYDYDTMVRMEVYDISDILNPQLLSGISDLGVPSMIEIEGDYIYTGNYDGFNIIDISIPETPEVVKTIEMGWYTTPRVGAVRDGYAYVVGSGDGSDFWVIDVDPPSEATIVFEDNHTDLVRDVTLHGDYAYATSESSHTIRVYNVADPLDVSFIDSVDTGYSIYSLDFHSDNAVMCASGWLKTFNMPDPATFIEITTASSPCGNSYDALLRDDYLYAIGGGIYGLNIIDVADPYNPVHTFAGSGSGRVITEYGDYAFVGAYEIFRVLDLSIPGTATEITTIPMPYSVKDIEIRGDYAFCLSTNEGIYIVDISDPTSPELVNSITTLGKVWSMDFYGDYMYVCPQDPYSGISIVDVTDVMSPVTLGTFGEEFQYAFDFTIIGDALWFATMNQDMEIYSLDNPLDPTPLGEVPDTWTVTGICLAGGYAFVGCTQGMWIMDITNPASPFIIQDFEYLPMFMEFTPDGYVFAVRSGLRIYTVD